VSNWIVVGAAGRRRGARREFVFGHG
jgi:hypothetical protein